MGVSVDDVARFGKTLELIENRLKVINQEVGYGIVNAVGNPLRLSLRKGRYSIDLCGEEFQSFGIWDCESAECAYTAIEGLNNGLWLLMRGGVLSCTTK